jgi:hypothetical protein
MFDQKPDTGFAPALRALQADGLETRLIKKGGDAPGAGCRMEEIR